MTPLAQQEVAKGLQLARHHNGVGFLDTLVEGKALHALSLLASHTLACQHGQRLALQGQSGFAPSVPPTCM